MTFPIPRAPKIRTFTPVPALPTIEEVSAGGVMIDFNDRNLPVALIARINRGGRLEWCLPKGHPEGRETKVEAAAREIEEETGISGEVITSLGSIDYWFNVSGHRVHKTVYHFLFSATGGQLTTENDPDHEAVDVAWVNIDEVSRKLSFPNERRIAEIAREYIIHQLF